MIIIGQNAKTLDDIKPLSADEVKTFIQGMEGYVKSETPLDIPVGVSGNDLARLTATLRQYKRFVEKVADVEAGIEQPGSEQLIERYGQLREEASELMASKPRLIIPK